MSLPQIDNMNSLFFHSFLLQWAQLYGLLEFCADKNKTWQKVGLNGTTQTFRSFFSFILKVLIYTFYCSLVIIRTFQRKLRTLRYYTWIPILVKFESRRKKKDKCNVIGGFYYANVLIQMRKENSQNGKASIRLFIFRHVQNIKRYIN